MKSTAVGELAVLEHQARHEVVADRPALRQRDDRLDVEDQPVVIERGAQFGLGHQRLGQDVLVVFRLGLRLGRDRRWPRGDLALVLLELGEGLGHLADDGAEHRDIGLDGLEPVAGIGVGHGIDALAQHLAGLGIGRQQAGEILDGLFEPRFGALAQLPLHQHHGHRSRRPAPSPPPRWARR